MSVSDISPFGFHFSDFLEESICADISNYIKALKDTNVSVLVTLFRKWTQGHCRSGERPSAGGGPAQEGSDWAIYSKHS